MRRAFAMSTLLSIVAGCAHAPTATAPTPERLTAQLSRDEVCRYRAEVGTRIPVRTCTSRDADVSRQLQSLDLLRRSYRY